MKVKGFFRIFVVLSVIITTCASIGLAQSTSVELIRLLDESSARYQEQSKKVKEYAERNNIPIVSRDQSGNLIVLVAIDEFGLPMFKTTDNAGAAITTGVIELQQGGELGLNLEGDGMSVGVWDGGSVSHSEFSDRILNTQGTDDDHANHVTGTILASGLNPSARGMAPKAKSYNFDFDNDEAEMLSLVTPDQTGLLLSNHSYGLITGWNFNGGWSWFGNIGISPDEDYRFGFYSANAAFWDQIAFNAPYYSIIKSAGNDRNNTGNGTRPPDCNGGSGYDCISDVSTSKNIITVGAVNKVLNYTDANSVGMSTFSSWGPTDDGRIKPDLVAAGVGLFSSFSQNNYGVFSGTSMATPNTTGSLVLLQELHKNLHGGNFMRASTLKALAIHTTKEAGFNPGPDYRFGWGLLDVEAAAKILLDEDEVNVIIQEETLASGETFEITLTPKENEKITATIVWTDPAGTPVAASLDPLAIMLVNDLDLRIIDDADNVQFPWILDPQNPDGAATKGDNIRDNVEKLVFDSPEPRNYKLVVSNKGALAGGSQQFSLILEYTSLNDPRTALYWIGGSGDWSDPVNWSLTSGGISANTIPGNNDRIFIDENSFDGTDQIINISSDVACGSLTWLTNDAASISLNSHNLEINGSLIITSSSFNFSTEGAVRLIGTSSVSNTINLGGSDLSKAALYFEGQGGSWTIGNNGKIGGIHLIEGDLDASELDLELGYLVSTGALPRSLDISNTEITGFFESNLEGSNLTLLSNSSSISLSGELSSVITWNNIVFDGELISSEQELLINGSTSSYSSISVNGNAEFTSNNSIEQFYVAPGSSVELNSGIQLTLNESLTLESLPDDKITLSAIGGGTASLFFEGYFKLCFDNLIIDGVNIDGSAVINAGENSTITNSTDWLEDDCDDVLFPKFSSNFSCVGSLIPFTDETSGVVETWSWDFGDPTSPDNTSTKQSPYHVYSSPGSYEVTLTVSNSNESRSYDETIEIGENLMLSNHVVISVDDLFSFRAASGYQWYKDDEIIVGATSRSFNFNGEPGIYFVITIEGDCNIKSSSALITDLENPTVASKISVYPNPASDIIVLSVPNELVQGNVTLSNTLGQVSRVEVIKENEMIINVQGLVRGFYVIRIDKGSYSITRKIVIK